MAVPLPPSFQEDVEAAVERASRDLGGRAGRRRDGGDCDMPNPSEPGFSYVPIDPCQGVIAALRTARGERIAREFIDLETPRFVPVTGAFPDPYALKRVSPSASPRRSWRRSRRRRPARAPSASAGWRRGCASWNRGIA